MSLRTLAAALAFALAAGPSFANTILFEDNFDAEETGFNVGLTNWDVTDGAIDVIFSGERGVRCLGGGGNCVDLDGTSPAGAGRISTKTLFELEAGASYAVFFNIAGNGRGGAPDIVDFGFGESQSQLTLASGDAFREVRFDIPMDIRTGRIFFDNQGADFLGAILDNVRLELIAREEPPPSDVPAPAAIALLGAGLFGLSTLRRRRA